MPDFIFMLSEPLLSEANGDKVAIGYYDRLDEAKTPHNKKMIKRKDIGVAKKFFLDKIQQGAKEQKSWKEIVFNAAYTLDYYFINHFFSGSKDNMLLAYAMAHYALKPNSVLANDIDKEQVRYDLFQEAAIMALLPHGYEDIKTANKLQDNLSDILYSNPDSDTDDRVSLAKRFAEAYTRLKNNGNPDSELQRLPPEKMKKWLKFAAEERKWTQFLDALERDEVEAEQEPPTASQAASSSVARFAMLPEQQQHHAARASSMGTMEMQQTHRGRPDLGYAAYQPQNYPQAGPSQQYSHPPFDAGSAGYWSTVNPSLPNYPLDLPSASSYPQGSSGPFPGYDDYAYNYRLYLAGSAHPAGPASDASTQAPRGNLFRPVPRRGAIDISGFAGAMQAPRPVLADFRVWGPEGARQRRQRFLHRYPSSETPPVGSAQATGSRTGATQQQELDLLNNFGATTSPGTQQEDFNSNLGSDSSTEPYARNFLSRFGGDSVR
ncbi:hypothetical protein ACQY0O_001099 [Thecaphora frezii]